MQAMEVASEKPSQLRTVQVLVVEDNAFNRKYVACILESAGYAVTEADHGAAALQILETRAELFDVVVMDLNMPVMDGLTATRRIRKSFPLLCIIALTSGSVFGESECIAAGCDLYLQKPIRKGQLSEAVANSFAMVGARDLVPAASDAVGQIRPATAAATGVWQGTAGYTGKVVGMPVQRGPNSFVEAMVFVGRAENDQVLAELATKVTNVNMRVEKHEVAVDDLRDGQHWAERALEVLERQMHAANERLEELGSLLNLVQDRQEEGSERTAALEGVVDTLAGDQQDLCAHVEQQEFSALQMIATPVPEVRLVALAPAIGMRDALRINKPPVGRGAVRTTFKAVKKV